MQILIQDNVLQAALLFLLCMLIIVQNLVSISVQVHQQCLIEHSLILQHDHASRNVLSVIGQISINLFVLQAALLIPLYNFLMKSQDHVYKYVLKDISHKWALKLVYKYALHHRCTLPLTSITRVSQSALQVTSETSAQAPVSSNAPKQPSNSQIHQ